MAILAKGNIIRHVRTVTCPRTSRFIAGTRTIRGLVIVGAHPLRSCVISIKVIMVRRKGNGREGGVIRITPVSLGQMGIVAGIARIVAVSKPGKLILGKIPHIMQIVLGCLVECSQDRCRTSRGTGATKDLAVIIVIYLLNATRRVMAVETEIVRLRIRSCGARVKVIRKQGERAWRPTVGRWLTTPHTGVHLMTVGTVASGISAHGCPVHSVGGVAVGRRSIIPGKGVSGKGHRENQSKNHPVLKPHHSPPPRRLRKSSKSLSKVPSSSTAFLATSPTLSWSRSTP